MIKEFLLPSAIPVPFCNTILTIVYFYRRTLPLPRVPGPWRLRGVTISRMDGSERFCAFVSAWAEALRNENQAFNTLNNSNILLLLGYV